MHLPRSKGPLPISRKYPGYGCEILVNHRDVIEGRGWKVKVCLHLAHLLSPVGSGICIPLVVDQQNSQRIKALIHSILEFNALNARRLALHLAEFFPSTVGRSFWDL